MPVFTTSRSKSITSARGVVRSAASPGFTFTRTTVPASGAWTCSSARCAWAAASCCSASCKAFCEVSSIWISFLCRSSVFSAKIHRHIRRPGVELEQDGSFLHALAFHALDLRHHAGNGGDHASARCRALARRFGLDGAVGRDIAVQR